MEQEILSQAGVSNKIGWAFGLGNFFYYLLQGFAINLGELICSPIRTVFFIGQFIETSLENKLFTASERLDANPEPNFHFVVDPDPALIFFRPRILWIATLINFYNLIAQ